LTVPFVKGLPDDRHGRSIIRAVLSICEELQLDAVAEGVETIGAERLSAGPAMP